MLLLTCIALLLQFSCPDAWRLSSSLFKSRITSSNSAKGKSSELSAQNQVGLRFNANLLVMKYLSLSWFYREIYGSILWTIFKLIVRLLTYLLLFGLCLPMIISSINHEIYLCFFFFIFFLLLALVVLTI